MKLELMRWCFVTMGLATAASAAVADTQPLDAARAALVSACGSQCYLDLTSPEGRIHTVRIKTEPSEKDKASNVELHFDARTDFGTWEGLSILSGSGGIATTRDWEEHAETTATLAPATDSYKQALRDLSRLVRVQNTPMYNADASLQQLTLRYLTELGYAE